MQNDYKNAKDTEIQKKIQWYIKQPQLRQKTTKSKN